MSVVGDAKIYNQIANAGRVRQVVDDLEISAFQARARGNPRCLNLVPGGPEEGTELCERAVVQHPPSICVSKATRTGRPFRNSSALLGSLS